MGDSAFVASKLLAKANELGKLCETTLQLVDREVAWRIFQVCLLASGKYHSRMLPPNIVAASAKRSSVHLRKAYEALLSEGHGPGVGVTEELKLPASPHANANAEAKARYDASQLAAPSDDQASTQRRRDSVRPEPLLRQAAKGRMDWLDITVT